MIKVKSKTQMLFVDTLLTGLLSGIILLAAFPLLSANIPAFPIAFLLSLLAAFCVTLLTRKLYILPILILTIIIAGFFLFLNEELSAHIRVILSLWNDSSESDIAPIIKNVFFFLFALGLSFPLFLIFRKLYSFYFVFALAAIPIIRLYFSGSDRFYHALTVLIFIVFITLAKSRGKAHAKLLSEKIEDSRAYHSMTAFLMIIAILLSTHLIVPKEDGEWQSELLVRTSRDISSLLRLDGRKRTLDGIFDIRMTGYQPISNRMGGDITPDYTIVMNVHTTTPTLLIGTYHDTYDGQRWYNTYGQTIFRYDSLILRRERNRVFLNRLPVGGSEAQALYDRLLTEGEFRIYSSVFGRSVFHAGQVESIYDTDFDADLLSFNEHGELFLDGSSRRGMNYKMDTVFIDRSRPRFDENVISLEQLVQSHRDPYYERMTEYYTQLPDTLPENVYDLASELTDSQLSPYQNALEIENWLADNCVYTLTPGTPPEGEDFVSHFLQTREGYCVYFASAMTVLARCVGLPARYVSGFSLSRSPSDTNYTHFLATNASAHVWTEIYFEGIGWIPFDASGRSGDSAYTINMELNEDDYIRPILSPSPTPIITVTPDIEEPDPQDTDGGRLFVPVIIFISLILSGIIIMMIIKMTYLIRDNKLYRKIHLKHKTSNEEKANHLFNRSLKQLSLLGVPLSPTETINEYLIRTQNRALAQRLDEVWQPVIKMKYANVRPAHEDIERLYMLCIYLEKQLLKQRGFPRYVVRRIFRFRQ